MKKNKVYLIDRKKYLCLLADKGLACACPIIPHKQDSGYLTKMSKAAIYSQFMLPDDIIEIGKVVGNNYRPY